VYSDIEGSLLVNNIPIGNYELSSLRQKAGIFFLYETVFNGTLWENVTMGGEVDQAYLQKLVEKSGLTNFLQTLPNGFDTELDATGKKLPMNVVQKILLVRALAHKPKLLLLEEPWRGIEEPMKSNIEDLLLSLEDTTVVVTTNEESFLNRADQVIRL
jgi:ABC-type multidrug transport system fused ATPase/permease subunit